VWTWTKSGRIVRDDASVELSNLNIDGQGSDAQLTVNWSDLGNEYLYDGVSVTMTNNGNNTVDYRVSLTIGSSGWNLIYDEVNGGEVVNVIFPDVYMGGNLAYNPQSLYDVAITVRDGDSFEILDTITGTLTILNPPT
jgi:hypothetical protein